MHYGDKKQTQENILRFVVYTHESDFGTFLEVCSIQECKYFPPRTLEQIINHPYNYITKDKVPLNEEWYEVAIKLVDYDTVEIMSVENVSNTENEFHRLH